MKFKYLGILLPHFPLLKEKHLCDKCKDKIKVHALFHNSENSLAD